MLLTVMPKARTWSLGASVMRVWVMVGLPVTATAEEPEARVLRAVELQPLRMREAVATAAVRVWATDERAGGCSWTISLMMRLLWAAGRVWGGATTGATAG